MAPVSRRPTTLASAARDNNASMAKLRKEMEAPYRAAAAKDKSKAEPGTVAWREKHPAKTENGGTGWSARRADDPRPRNISAGGRGS